jgi:hypothetical protein
MLQLRNFKYRTGAKIVVFIYLDILTLVFCLVGPTKASAADQTQTLEVQGIKISPFIFEETILKGNSYSGEIQLTNTTQSEVGLSVSIRDFIPAGRHGEVRFLPTNQQTDPHFSLSSWVEITKQPVFQLKAGQSTTTGFRVTVPPEADDGSHYGGILFSFDQGAAASGSKVIQSIGAIIIAKTGKANGQANIHSFNTTQNLYTKSTILLRTEFENTGNVHVIPKGKIEITNIFGRLTGLTYVNPNAQISLPNTNREFESLYQGGFMLGKYQATLVLFYGNPKIELRATTKFWVFPWKQLVGWTLSVLLLTLLLLAFIKRYNRWIVKKNQTKT